MDADARDRWSNLAHRNRRLCSPIDEARFAAFLQALPLPLAPYVVDLGCGKGEALRLIAELRGGTGTGVDASARMLAEAPGERGRVEFVHGDAAAWHADRAPDLMICMGSTHIFGGLAGASAALAAMVRPGGIVLLGDGYWRSEPSTENLRGFGMDAGELTRLDEMVECVAGHNLVPIAVQPSTETEWDHYEWSLIRSIELWAMENPDDPDVEAFLAQSRMMRRTFLGWRRQTMGFALVAAVNSAAGAATA